MQMDLHTQKCAHTHNIFTNTHTRIQHIHTHIHNEIIAIYRVLQIVLMCGDKVKQMLENAANWYYFFFFMQKCKEIFSARNFSKKWLSW